MSFAPSEEGANEGRAALYLRDNDNDNGLGDTPRGGR